MGNRKLTKKECFYVIFLLCSRFFMNLLGLLITVSCTVFFCYLLLQLRKELSDWTSYALFVSILLILLAWIGAQQFITFYFLKKLSISTPAGIKNVKGCLLFSDDFNEFSNFVECELKKKTAIIPSHWSQYPLFREIVSFEALLLRSGTYIILSALDT